MPLKHHDTKGTEDERSTFEQQEDGLLHTAGLFRYPERGVSFYFGRSGHGKSAKCKQFYTPETDGLKAPWNIGGSVFCNPPYGRALGAWVRKAYEEAQAGTTVVLLIPARTDTTYFHDYIYGKAEIRFLRGRLHFEDEDGNRFPPAPFPSMVVVYNGRHHD